MKEFNLRISSPEGDLFLGDIVKLNLRASGGDIAIMAGHIPFISYVKPGLCSLELADGTERKFELDGGVLTVGREKTILLTGNFAWKE